jgi:hypothetical protein
MIADVLTKPLQGTAFRNFRSQMMDSQSVPSSLLQGCVEPTDSVSPINNEGSSLVRTRHLSNECRATASNRFVALSSLID